MKGVKQDVPPLSSCLRQSSDPVALSVSDVQSVLVCFHVLQDAPVGTKTKELTLQGGAKVSGQLVMNVQACTSQ